ncbi:MAG: tetratricopeptide repeat protein [Candidatus Heimdallarchaeota archaeon]|nr:tetratricopeptide repeat protein [Candidatus Heimdallarchaeota archaeon]MCK4878900.1 tetratricopeptide repeat protein [Candidatus Heimdallarchaeota archaeon]
MMKNKIETIENLIKEGEYKSALAEILKNSKKTNISGDEKLTLLYLNSIVLDNLGEYSNSIILAHKMHEIAKKENNKLREIDALIAEVFANYRLNRIEDALRIVSVVEELIEECDIEGINERKSQLLVNKVYIYTDKGDANQAYIYAQDNYYLCREIKETSHSARSYHALGWAFMHMGDRDKAIKNYEKSLEIREKIGNQHSIAHTLFSLGFTWLTKGKLDTAEEYFTRCLKIRERIGNQQDIVWTVLDLGDVFYGKGENTQAQIHYENALLISQEIDYKFGIVFSLMQLTRIFEELDNPKLVIDTLEKALNYAERIEIVDPEAFVLFSLIDFITKRNLKSKLTKVYLDRLEEINRSSRTKIFDQAYRLAKALIYKTSESSRSRKKAKIVLHQIIDEEIINFNYTKIAMLNYGEILAEDLKRYLGEDFLTDQFTELTNILSPKQFHSVYSTVAENFLDQSKSALEEIDFAKARELIRRAEHLCDFLELYNKGPTPFRIIYALFVKERNLNELSKILHITKGALSSQIKLLINLDFVKVSREEQVRSATMLKKYYMLSSKGLELIQPFKLNIANYLKQKKIPSEDQLESLMIPRLIMKMIRDSTFFVDKYQDFIEENIILKPLEGFEDKKTISEDVKEIEGLLSEIDDIEVNHFFLTNGQYKTYMKLWDEFVEKVQKEVISCKIETSDFQSTEKPKLVSHMTLPIKELMILERLLESKRKEKVE